MRTGWLLAILALSAAAIVACGSEPGAASTSGSGGAGASAGGTSSAGGTGQTGGMGGATTGGGASTASTTGTGGTGAASTSSAGGTSSSTTSTTTSGTGAAECAGSSGPGATVSGAGAGGGDGVDSVDWQAACWQTWQGQQFQAIEFQYSAPMQVPIQATLFFTTNCDPSQGTDNLNDFNAPTPFGPWVEWFIHHPGEKCTSAIWSFGTHTTGCIDYSKAPDCQ